MLRDEPTQPSDDGGIGDVSAIPCKQYIHPVGGGERNVAGVAVSRRGEEPGLQHTSGKRFNVRC